MSVNLSINGAVLEAGPGPSLFDYADEMGVEVPTSCQKNGKCKECIVEVVSGMEFLSERTSDESHLRDRFRLACCCHVAAGAAGEVRCHTMRRGQMRIERQAFELPVGPAQMPPDPARPPPG